MKDRFVFLEKKPRHGAKHGAYWSRPIAERRELAKMQAIDVEHSLFAEVNAEIATAS